MLHCTRQILVLASQCMCVARHFIHMTVYPNTYRLIILYISEEYIHKQGRCNMWVLDVERPSGWTHHQYFNLLNQFTASNKLFTQYIYATGNPSIYPSSTVNPPSHFFIFLLFSLSILLLELFSQIVYFFLQIPSYRKIINKIIRQSMWNPLDPPLLPWFVWTFLNHIIIPLITYFIQT